MATKPKFTDEEIKEHVKKIQKLIEEQKQHIKEGEGFTAIKPEEAEQKLRRVNSPMIVFQTGSWTMPQPVGSTFTYNVGFYNPDPVQVWSLFAHVWVGSGNVDPTTGTFLLNVDTRFPRLTQPPFPGLSIPAGGWTSFTYSMTIPLTVERTSYLGNTCLMSVNWHDIGTYLDRAVFVFTVF